MSHHTAFFSDSETRGSSATDTTFSSSHSPTLSLLDEAVLFIFWYRRAAC